jgi:hypothetical protein
MASVRDGKIARQAKLIETQAQSEIPQLESVECTRLRFLRSLYLEQEVTGILATEAVLPVAYSHNVVSPLPWVQPFSHIRSGNLLNVPLFSSY